MTLVPVASLKRLILGTLVAACTFAAPCISSQAADLGPDYRVGARHVRTAWHYSSWRDAAPLPAITAFMLGTDTSTAIHGMTVRPRLPTRAAIATAIDGYWRLLAPLAAETAAHSRLSEL